MRRAIIVGYLCAVLLTGALTAWAQAGSITYQGVLSDPDGVAVPDGAYTVSAALYASPSGGAPVWSETHPGVVCISGAFSVPLGGTGASSAQALAQAVRNNAALWIELAVETQPGLVETFLPRQALGSAPHALSADAAGVAFDAAASGMASDTVQEALEEVQTEKANTADVYTKTEVDTSQSAQDAVISGKANAVDVYTKAQVDTSQSAQNTLINNKANIIDVYTKSQVDTSQANQTASILVTVNDSLAAQNLLINGKANVVDVYTMAQVDTLQADQTSSIFVTLNDSQAAQTNSILVTLNDSQAAQNLLINGKLELDGEAHVFVGGVTADPVANGNALKAAYVAAAAKTPYGAARGAENRYTVFVLPGRYDVTTGLIMDLEFVDLVGVSTARDDQVIYGATNGNDTGVLQQTANSVRIENLVVRCTRASGSLLYNSSDPAAYLPASNLPLTKIRNCSFIGNNYSHAMRVGIEYRGVYEDCSGSDRSFGYYGTASGTFTNCVVGDRSFGYNSVASGTFTNCTGGDRSFGADFGTASGTFTNCTGGVQAFGGWGGWASGTFTNCDGGSYAFAGFSGVASGTFTNCTGGDYAFGGGSYARDGGENSLASGTFENCKGGDYTFGGGLNGIASGAFRDCTGLTNSFGGDTDGVAGGTFEDCEGGDYSFGGGLNGIASGTFTNCIGLTNSFGGNTDGTASGQFLGCSGGLRSFGGSTRGTASGVFRDCVGGDYSFGGRTDGSIVGGRFYNCTGGADAFGGGVGGQSSAGPLLPTRLDGCQMLGNTWQGTFQGRMQNCRWATGITCGNGARIYSSIFAGTVNLNNSTAGIGQSAAHAITNTGSAVFNLSNFNDPDVN